MGIQEHVGVLRDYFGPVQTLKDIIAFEDER